jgi:hypothetical protein
MKLIHDSDQDIWRFVQGDSIIPLDGQQIFRSREQAVTTARQVGLAIDKVGNVAIAGRSSSRLNTKRNKTSEARDSNDFSAHQRRITLWLDAASIGTLDQLAQAHGSRGEAVRWLLTHVTLT